MLHLAIKGILGRKKETALLLAVLLLSFVFTALIAALLPTTDRVKEEERLSVYGGWKLLITDPNEQQLDSYAQAVDLGGADCAKLQVVGTTQASEMISVMSDTVKRLGRFELREGSLPVSEDEILIVENQFMPKSQLKVGDKVRVGLSYDVDYYDEQLADNRRTISYFYDRAVAKNEHIVRESWENGTNDTHLWAHNIAATLDTPYDELEQYQKNYLYWGVLDETLNLVGKSEVRGVAKALVPNNSFDISVTKNTVNQTLKGPALEENDGKTLTTDIFYENLLLHREYTVCGVVKSYQANWNGGDTSLPDAFLSVDGANAVNEAVNAANAYEGFLAKKKDGPVLLVGGEGSVEQLYSALKPYLEEASFGKYGFVHYDEFTMGLIAINEETGEQEELQLFYSGEGSTLYGPGFNVSWDEIYSPDFKIEGYSRLPASMPTFEVLLLGILPTIRLNVLGYPMGVGSQSGALSIALNAILIIMTACAILVICLVQSRRRVQSLILLKSIGLNNGQGASMALIEAVSLLAIATVLGLPIGTLIANLVLGSKGLLQLMTFDYTFMAVSVLLGGAATLIGLQIPMIYAATSPLVGKRSAIRPPKGRVTMICAGGQLAVLKLEVAARSFNRRRDLVAKLLCAAAIVLALLTLLLGHTAMDDYRLSVVRSDRADYSFTQTFGMNERYLQEKFLQLKTSEKLLELPQRVEAWTVAEHTTVRAQGLENDPALSAAKKGESLFANAYCMASDSHILAQLCKLCNLSKADIEKLNNGTGCILMLPKYRKNSANNYDFSFDIADSGSYLQNDAIAVGDTINLSAQSHTVSTVSLAVTSSQSEIDLEVLGVVHSFGEIGLWPFTQRCEPISIVGGSKLLKEVYPLSGNRYDADQARWNRTLQDIHCQWCQGRTEFHVWDEAQEDQTPLYWSIALEEGYDMENLRLDKYDLLSSATNQRSMTVLLGAVAVALVAIILLFILKDLADQSRNRTGILRALGCSRKRFVLSRVLIGLWDGLISVLIANAIMIIIVLVATLARMGFANLEPATVLQTVRLGLLWQYPWTLHGLICLGGWVLISLMRAIPFAKLGTESIIGAIKGLE